MAYVDIASNPGLKTGLLKIGLSSVAPESRLRALSRSTAAPANFQLAFFKVTQRAARVETRVHSLLEGCRLRAHREFFERWTW